MSILKDHVHECKHERDKAISDLTKLTKERALLGRARIMGSEVAQAEIDRIESEIEAGRAVVARRCQEFAAAFAALEAENKLEGELTRAEKRERRPAQEIEVDDLGL